MRTGKYSFTRKALPTIHPNTNPLGWLMRSPRNQWGTTSTEMEGKGGRGRTYNGSKERGESLLLRGTEGNEERREGTKMYAWLGSRVVSVLDSGAEGRGSNRSRDAVG